MRCFKKGKEWGNLLKNRGQDFQKWRVILDATSIVGCPILRLCKGPGFSRARARTLYENQVPFRSCRLGTQNHFLLLVILARGCVADMMTSWKSQRRKRRWHSAEMQYFVSLLLLIQENLPVLFFAKCKISSTYLFKSDFSSVFKQTNKQTNPPQNQVCSLNLNVWLFWHFMQIILERLNSFQPLR